MTKVDALCTGKQSRYKETNMYTTEQARNRDSTVYVVTGLWA
jgi:hypothetical protein